MIIAREHTQDYTPVIFVVES